MGSSQSGEEFHVGKGPYIITISRYIETQISAIIPFQFNRQFSNFKVSRSDFPVSLFSFPAHERRCAALCPRLWCVLATR